MKQNLAKIESQETKVQRSKYIPAMSHDSLTRFYDPLTDLMGMNKLRQRVIEHLQLRNDLRILDVGCGTGTLLQMLKKAQPNTQLTGIDGDPKILKIAQAKTETEALKYSI